MTSLHRRARFLLERAPVALLVAVALVQISLSRSEFLLAWKGGGFGMFAVLDGVEFREIRAADPQGASIEIPSSVFEIERRARTHPSDDALEELAQALEQELAGTRVESLEVWRSDWSGDPMRPTRHLIASHRGASRNERDE